MNNINTNMNDEKPVADQLSDMLIELSNMPTVKGKQQVIKNIKSSLLFMASYRVDNKTKNLILEARKKDLDALSGPKYEQQAIDWSNWNVAANIKK